MPKAIPNHLKIYLSQQNYEAYTPENQSVWRYTMRQLKDFLSVHAHECYLRGLKKTGISADRIPKLEEVDKKLRKYGWGAVPVSGFIPPAAFMELQSLGYLPVASEMRTIEHIHYTPAPDIVHEAAGHAPILANKEFANYLKRYAEVSAKAIISKEDIDIYEAIRALSDAKEHTNVSKKEIRRLEDDLEDKSTRVSFVSEAGLLSRMNWWTAEYGLIGNLQKPRIFGAGLLSSIGESRDCLKHHVRKIPLTLNCLEYGYDITEQQPQLFVTPSFKHLSRVLDQLAEQMAFHQGGRIALEKVRQARTVNTVELDTGLQLSGVLNDFSASKDGVFYLKFAGPTQLSYKYQQLDGQGKDYHKHGYSSPIGWLKGQKKCLSKMTLGELAKMGIRLNQATVLSYKSGVVLSGTATRIWKKNGRNLVIRFKNCCITYNNEILFHPEWGDFDLALGSEVVSAYGGPADRKAYGLADAFASVRVPKKKYTAQQKARFKLYKEIRALRDKLLGRRKLTAAKKMQALKQLEKLTQVFFKQHKRQWLIGLELLEIARHLNAAPQLEKDLLVQLSTLSRKSSELQVLIGDGLRLANKL